MGLAGAALLAITAIVTGCGSSSSSSTKTTAATPATSAATTLALDISEAGTTAKFSGPARSRAGW